LDPIGQRHDDIYHDELNTGTCGLQDLHTFFTALCLEHAKTPLAQKPVGHAANGRLVIDDQNTGCVADVWEAQFSA
jgi:hypothetical protein